MVFEKLDKFYRPECKIYPINMIADTYEDCVIYDGKGWLDSYGAISTLEEVTDVASADDCMQNACHDHPQCIAFTYIESLQRCDLKTEEQAVIMGDDSTSVMSVKSPKSCHFGRFL